MKIRFFLFLMVVFSHAFSQSGYKISFKIKGWKDTTAYLGHFYGESTYIKDTARVSKSGEFFFDNKITLPQGVYFLLVNKNRFFDFVVGNDQFFTLETEMPDYV